jgi:plasmid stabilization system protein ParE
MPVRYQFTPRALDDLDAIWNYIAEDNISAANRAEASILEACVSLARHPLLGSKRTEITDLSVRFWAVTRFPNYILVCRPETTPLQVIAVLHGKREIESLLDAPGNI